MVAELSEFFRCWHPSSDGNRERKEIGATPFFRSEWPDPLMLAALYESCGMVASNGATYVHAVCALFLPSNCLPRVGR